MLHTTEGRTRVAKILMTGVLVVGSVLSFVLDWSGNHLLNPLWHAHARFHGALLLFSSPAFLERACG